MCREAHEQKTVCGRPLGMDFDRQGRLVVADMFMGVYRVDVDRGTMQVRAANYMSYVQVKTGLCFNLKCQVWLV